MKRLWRWFKSDPYVGICLVLILLIGWEYARGWMILAGVLWLIFRACRWIGRKFCFDPRYSNYDDWDFCGDPRWPRRRFSRLFAKVLA